MSREAFLPCFVCGTTLLNAFPHSENQPQEASEFRTYGHYGSTFWDSFDGEQLVLNVCDDCLRKHPERLAQQKRYKPILCERADVGREWVDRPMVPFTGNTDAEDLHIEVEEVGTNLSGRVEWIKNVDEVKQLLAAQLAEEERAQAESESHS